MYTHTVALHLPTDVEGLEGTPLEDTPHSKEDTLSVLYLYFRND